MLVMSSFFNRERFGTPQLIAAILLLFFLGQCAWFISHVPLTQVESNYILGGMEMLRSGADAGDQLRSPVVALIAVTPAYVLVKYKLLPTTSSAEGVTTFYEPNSHIFLDQHRWFIRAPFLLMGLLLGASVWYVARRLYGNAGGYIALGLYVFSPAFVTRSSLAQPEIAAAWGIFGVIFTSIAVAHTLYAPREVILWNWRRIMLLGISIALAVGAQFSCAVLLLLALAFMWWAVPHRRPAAFGILLSACGVALVLLWAAYLFNPFAMFHGFARGQWLRFSPAMIASAVLYHLVGVFYLRDAAASSLMVIVSLGTYFAWKRTRFFGNTAPLLTAALLIVLAVAMPSAAGFTFVYLALPFLIVFSSGVFADLLESKFRNLALGVAVGVCLMQAVLGLSALFQLGNLR